MDASQTSVFMEIHSPRGWKPSPLKLISVPLQALQPGALQGTEGLAIPDPKNADGVQQLPGIQDLPRPLPKLSTAEREKGGWKAEDISEGRGMRLYSEITGQ